MAAITEGGSELVEAVNGARVLNELAEGSEAASGGRFIDFAHGSSLESIQNIVNNGFNETAARAASRGGRVNIPGSFFTIETSQPGAIQGAYEFGLNRASKPAVLSVRLPSEVFEGLQGEGLVITRLIAGYEELNETIFRPGSYGTLNQHATFPEIIDPYAPR